MRVTSNVVSMIVHVSLFSSQVMGLVLRPVVTKEVINLREVAKEYVVEVKIQNGAIEEVKNQLSLGQVAGTNDQLSEVYNVLLESYYRQTEPRNRMVEMTPTDSVLDSSSIEYLVAVASRYATNVMHLARKLREGSVEEENLIEEVNNLIKEHSKTQMFDQMLLELANVSLSEAMIEAGSDSISSLASEPHEASRAEEKEKEEEEVEVMVKVEQEIHTTTTETIVKSYTETAAAASW